MLEIHGDAQATDPNRRDGAPELLVRLAQRRVGPNERDYRRAEEEDARRLLGTKELEEA
jgi:hypothetical protein